MKKAIKDMTQAEKQDRIFHLSLKFYDIDSRPSTLLWEEMQNITPNEQLQAALKELETLEIQADTLEAEYSQQMGYAMRQLSRKFRYEQEKLEQQQTAEKHAAVSSFDPIRKFTANSLADTHRQKRAELICNQIAEKSKIEAAAHQKIDENNKKLYSVFMRAIRHIYR
jgi:hypothetical protein